MRVNMEDEELWKCLILRAQGRGEEWRYQKWKWISPLDPPTWQPIQNNYHIHWWVNGPNSYSIFIMDNEEPLTHLMDYSFGPVHSSETLYLTINCVTPVHQINIQQLIL